MVHETESQKSEISRWSRLAIQLNGAVDTGRYEHITTAVIQRELPAEVWTISKLTDVDRHKLAQHWRLCSQGFEPYPFHVRRNGLALLVAYLLHLIDVIHVTPPK